MVKKEAGSRAKMGCLTSLDSTLPYEENNCHSLLGADQNVFALEIAFLSVAEGARRPDMLGPLNSCLCQSFSQTSGITPNFPFVLMKTNWL